MIIPTEHLKRFRHLLSWWKSAQVAVARNSLAAWLHWISFETCGNLLPASSLNRTPFLRRKPFFLENGQHTFSVLFFACCLSYVERIRRTRSYELKLICETERERNEKIKHTTISALIWKSACWFSWINMPHGPYDHMTTFIGTASPTHKCRYRKMYSYFIVIRRGCEWYPFSKINSRRERPSYSKCEDVIEPKWKSFQRSRARRCCWIYFI